MKQSSKKSLIRFLMSTKVCMIVKIRMLELSRDVGLITYAEREMLTRFMWLNHGLRFSNATSEIQIIPNKPG